MDKSVVEMGEPWKREPKVPCVIGLNLVIGEYFIDFGMVCMILKITAGSCPKSTRMSTNKA